MNQKTALEILKLGHNVFLTGAAGSGKTYLLNQFINYLKNSGVSAAVTASTGIAATHMNGITIHSWSGLGIRDKITEKDLRKLSRNQRVQRRMEKTKVLIVDEISMLHAHQLDNVDKICRFLKDEPFIPFGGLQVVLCGDFFQLPPVQKNRNEETNFAYASRVWQEMNLKICYLEEQHRQKDDRMLELLNDIRGAKVGEKTWEIILSRENKEIFGIDQPTKLFTHNVDVDGINNRELGKIKEKSLGYAMRARGNKKLVEFLKQSCLAPEKLILKKGARVMFVKNNFDEGYVNGTVGNVIGFFPENNFPIVRTLQGRKIIVSPAVWEVLEDDVALARIKQIPLRLAWAITVHKSQGMSLDAAEIDLGKSFKYGMGYVALSRVRKLSGIKLLGINEMALEVNEKIYELDQKLIMLSKEVEREIEK
ncbi:MAG: AAA family ATPase [Parcubacteria group bacterium]